MLLPHPRGPPKPPGHPVARSLKENRDVYPEYPQRRVVLRSRNLYVLLNAEGDAPALVEGGLRDFFLPRDQQPADEIRRPLSPQRDDDSDRLTLVDAEFTDALFRPPLAGLLPRQQLENLLRPLDGLPRLPNAYVQDDLPYPDRPHPRLLDCLGHHLEMLTVIAGLSIPTGKTSREGISASPPGREIFTILSLVTVPLFTSRTLPTSPALSPERTRASDSLASLTSERTLCSGSCIKTASPGFRSSPSPAIDLPSWKPYLRRPPRTITFELTAQSFFSASSFAILEGIRP